jgi:hypothetical protein
VRPSVRGSSCKCLASATMKNTFISSLGCNENEPIGIQRWEPRTSRPSKNTNISITMPAT